MAPLTALMLLAAVYAGPFEEGGVGPEKPAAVDSEERVFVELRPGAGRVIPGNYNPRGHFEVGGGVSGVFHPGSVKLMVGVVGDYVLNGHLHESDSYPSVTPIDSERYQFTELPVSTGHFIRIRPRIRVGAENTVAFGYVALGAGYSLRMARLRCTVPGECNVGRLREHGLAFEGALGAIFRPWSGHGLGIGLEIGLVSSVFPGQIHPHLPAANHAVAASAILGWGF